MGAFSVDIEGLEASATICSLAAIGDLLPHSEQKAASKAISFPHSVQNLAILSPTMGDAAVLGQYESYIFILFKYNNYTLKRQMQLKIIHIYIMHYRLKVISMQAFL